MTFKLKASIAGALALALAAGAAIAQPPAGEGGGGGPGGGGGGRGAALRQACGADIQKFCANVQGPDMRKCVRDNFASLSDGCQSFLKQMRSRRQDNPQGGGAGPAPQQ
jgi:hypothetical protein